MAAFSVFDIAGSCKNNVVNIFRSDADVRAGGLGSLASHIYR